MAKKSIYSNSDISALCSELASIVQSGITVSDGLFMMCEEEPSEDKKKTLKQMLGTLENGGSLKQAFELTGSFPSYFIEMVEIGEQTGRIENVLFSLSGTAICRAAVIVIAVLAALLIIGVILYHFTGFKKVILSAAAHTRTAKALYSARFANALALTLSSGMDIDESVAMSEKLIENPVMLEKIRQVRKDMSEGSPFVDAVSVSGLFSGVYTHMINIGFSTGTIDSVMNEIALKNEAKVNNVMRTAVNRFEPAMIVIMSVIVGFILLSVMLPLLGIMSVIG